MKKIKPLHISVYRALELIARGGLSDNFKLRIATRLEREGSGFLKIAERLRKECFTRKVNK